MEGVTTMSMIGERLTVLRESRGWSKTYTAEKLGVKAMSTYANWEYGNREPDAQMLAKMADVFDVTVDYLLGRSDHKDYTKEDSEEFNRFKNDPSLEKWYKELPESKDEDLRKLRKMWEILKDNGEI